jgi:hypothetical protein
MSSHDEQLRALAVEVVEDINRVWLAAGLVKEVEPGMFQSTELFHLLTEQQVEDLEAGTRARLEAEGR